MNWLWNHNLIKFKLLNILSSSTKANDWIMPLRRARKIFVKWLHDYFEMIDHKQNKKGLNNKICPMCDAMNTNHEWSKLRLDLDCNFHAIALKYTNLVNILKNEFVESNIKVQNTSLMRTACTIIVVRLANYSLHYAFQG
jgi:hypothetical protein